VGIGGVDMGGGGVEEVVSMASVGVEAGVLVAVVSEVVETGCPVQPAISIKISNITDITINDLLFIMTPHKT
jgi:hypothetical protein